MLHYSTLFLSLWNRFIHFRIHYPTGLVPWNWFMVQKTSSRCNSSHPLVILFQWYNRWEPEIKLLIQLYCFPPDDWRRVLQIEHLCWVIKRLVIPYDIPMLGSLFANLGFIIVPNQVIHAIVRGCVYSSSDQCLHDGVKPHFSQDAHLHTCLITAKPLLRTNSLPIDISHPRTQTTKIRNFAEQSPGLLRVDNGIGQISLTTEWRYPSFATSPDRSSSISVTPIHDPWIICRHSM